MKNKIQVSIFVLWLLSLATLATIYLAWFIYPLENHNLNLAASVSLSDHELLHNFNQLMSYLTLPWVSELKMSDFPSSSEALAHFRDVKHLFHLVQVLFLLGIIPSYQFLKKHFNSHSLWLHSRLFLALIVLPVFLAFLGMMIGFDQFFTLFHQLLFPGADNWLFNPYTDPIIWVLPETYFLHCFLLFFAFYEILMLSLWLWSRRQFKCYQAKERKSFRLFS
ncbi:TIGR01906 family membrane protein [Streptococcus dentapri]|uniref:TIGR01906 family membrane protein n=1 Tax=Streptococcus dentapri TaxID=573564 RepID=A0ABV8CZ33_9STRE